MSDMEGFELKYFWLEAPTVSAPELRATWARLEIWAGGACVTATSDSRQSIYVPLYPIAEWLAYNWWIIAVDSRPGRLPISSWQYGRLLESRTSNDDWLRYHNLRSAGEGFPWPDLTIVKEDESYFKLAWSPTLATPRLGFRYVSRGTAVVPRHNFLESLTDFVNAVVTRLEETGIMNTKLQEEWAALSLLDQDEQEFCQAAARLGLDPFTVPGSVANSILFAGESLDRATLAEVLDVAPPYTLRQVVEWVQSAETEIERLTSPPMNDLVELRKAMEPTRSTDDRPWLVGLAQARSVRATLELPPTERLDIDAFVSATALTSTNAAIEGVGLAQDGCRFVTVEGLRNPDRRFSLARALWHALTLPAGKFVVTRAYGNQQKIERAFAAELLAPSTGIRDLINATDQALDASEVSRIAETYEVNPLVVSNQIDNNVFS